jgi:hypothetical protein
MLRSVSVPKVTSLWVVVLASIVNGVGASFSFPEQLGGDEGGAGVARYCFEHYTLNYQYRYDNLEFII